MNNSFFQRLGGVLTFKAPVYREIAHDPAALQPAALIVLITSLIVGILQAIISPQAGALSVASSLLIGIISWPIGSFITALIVANFFKGQTDTGEMLRILGHLYVFNVLAVIPCIGTVAGLVLSTIGLVIAIRESAGISTNQAIIAAVVVFIVSLVIGIVLGLLLGVGGVALFMLGAQQR